jgi:hypothetical protein
MGPSKLIIVVPAPAVVLTVLAAAGTGNVTVEDVDPAAYATPVRYSNCLDICHKRFSSVPHPICLLGIAMIVKINVQRYATF